MAALNWKIAGAAGEGIKIAGLIMSKVALRSGYFVNGYTEYPSLIRGGHNTYQALIAETNLTAPQIKLDLLIALNSDGVNLHLNEIDDHTRVLANTELYPNQRALNLPMSGMMKNTFALGASCFFLNLELTSLNEILKESFGRKGEAVVTENLATAKLGFDFAAKNYADKKFPKLIPANTKKQIFLSGNEALGLGSIAGGMKFYSAYPMTPTSALLSYMAKKEAEFKLVVRHAEDEIGVINMAIGASFAGVKAMVGTSGGGFSLMVEGLGLAGVSETPIVINLGMRPGPATGMPTWTGQGDLLFAINASQDEFPRIVLTPGDLNEAFSAGRLAQIWAQKYQLPVIIITDKHLAEDYATTQIFNSTWQASVETLADTSHRANNDPFERYADSDSGISLRTLPGQPGGVQLTNSYEHNRFGYATEAAAERKTQVDKRFKKVKTVMADPDRLKPALYGPKEAELTLVSWGSNKTTILQALPELPEVNFIHFPWVWPFPQKEFGELIKGQNRFATVEGNSQGQLNRLIRQETGFAIKDQLLKYDGRPINPEEVTAYARQFIK